MYNELFTVLGLLVVAIIGTLSAFAILYLLKLKKRAQAEIEKIDDEKAKELANNALQRIADLAVSVVDSIQQEIVGAIRKGIEEGTHTKEDLYALRDQAVSRVIGQITDDVKSYALYQINDIETYVQDLVSQEVLNLRAQNIK